MSWRFACYEHFPYKWAAYVHPAIERSDQDNVVDEFFGLKKCCLDKHFGAKVYKAFDGKASGCKADNDFRSLITTLSICYAFTDMWTERLLARIRKSVMGSPECDVERLCASGYVTQWLAEHLLRGGDNPCAATRQQLIEDGVPLRCAAKKKKAAKGPQRPCGPFVHWLGKEDADRKARGQKLDKGAYNDWRRGKAVEWNNLPKMVQDVNAKEAEETFANKRAEEKVEAGPRRGAAAGSYLAHVLDKVSSARTPYTSEAFERRIHVELGGNGNDDNQRRVGFTRYCDLFREKLRERIFVKNKNAIPDTTKVEYYVPCGLAHPGLCAESDADTLPPAIACAKALLKYCRSAKCGSFHGLRICSEHDEERMVWFTRNHCRGSGPAVALITPCALDGESLLLTMNRSEDGLATCLHDVTFVGLIMKTGFAIRNMYGAPAAQDRDNLSLEADAIYVKADWWVRHARSEAQVYPMPLAETSSGRGGARKKAMLAGLYDLPGQDHRRRRRRGEEGARARTPGVKLVKPGGGGPPKDGASSSEGSSGPGERAVLVFLLAFTNTCY